MNKVLKNAIKLTPFYPVLKKIKKRLYLYNLYSRKNSVNFVQSIKQLHICDYNLSKILNKCKINNIGFGVFFYSLDHSVVVNTDRMMIGSFPPDYEHLINRKFGNNSIDLTLKKYIKKINDPRISTEQPYDLKSALQSILFWNSLLWQTGHFHIGLGRIDKTLSKYNVSDNAESLICDFLRTLHCECNFKSLSLKGDTGQIITLGGLESDGNYFCNEYTKLFIKCLSKVHLPDPKILLRCSRNMPQDLMDLAIECNATGIGSPLFSNDDVVIPKLIDFGYDEKDAYNYGVSACWEPLSIGNSLEQNNIAKIDYGKCIFDTISDKKFLNCDSISDIESLFNKKLEDMCFTLTEYVDSIKWQNDPLLSHLMELKMDISEGGAKYNNFGITTVGMSAAVNSLLNINNFVFNKKIFSLKEVQNAIRNNYSDLEKMQKLVSENLKGFGTDNGEAISTTNRIISKTEEIFKNYRNKFGGKIKFGLSSPDYISSGKFCGATFDGRKAGESFDTHISRDKGEPLTEILNFESKLKFTGTSANANVLDVMVPVSLIKDNIKKFSMYMMAGIREGIFQLQMNVLSYSQLLDAKAHPEKYPNLIVRVWGFSAYFNDLPEEYKDHLIERAKNMERIA